MNFYKNPHTMIPYINIILGFLLYSHQQKASFLGKYHEKIIILFVLFLITACNIKKDIYEL